MTTDLWRSFSTERELRATLGVGSRRRFARLDAILHALEREGRLALPALAAELGVSAATLRRDLRLLEDAGLLARTHGGAGPGAHSTELPLAIRDARQREAKRRIAAAVADLVPRGRCAIALSGGSTTAAVARELSARRDVTIVTNSLTVAEMPQSFSGMRVIVTGGLLRAQSMELVGVIAERALGSAHTELAVLGADGVDAVAGFTTHDETEARTNHAMVAKARRRVVAADGSKVGNIALAQLASVNEIDLLVTDTSADPTRIDGLRAAGLEVLVV